MKSSTARVSEKIESAIQSAIELYEEQHDLEWCDGSYDPDEIKEAAEMLLSAKDAEVCICIGYSLAYIDREHLEDYFSEVGHRTSRIHLHGNAVAFTVDLREPGSCSNHENVLIPRVDTLSKGKAALFAEAENGNAIAMFALSRLFDQGIGEPQDPIEAYFWHSVGMEFCECDWTCEGFVDAAADQEILAARLPHGLVNENGSLHKRAKDWIHMHRALLPKGNSQNGDCLDDEFDAIDDEQDDADEE
jgi:TPR repeat protein